MKIKKLLFAILEKLLIVIRYHKLLKTYGDGSGSSPGHGFGDGVGFGFPARGVDWSDAGVGNSAGCGFGDGNGDGSGRDDCSGTGYWNGGEAGLLITGYRAKNSYLNKL